MLLKVLVGCSRSFSSWNILEARTQRVLNRNGNRAGEQGNVLQLRGSAPGGFRRKTQGGSVSNSNLMNHGEAGMRGALRKFANCG